MYAEYQNKDEFIVKVEFNGEQLYAGEIIDPETGMRQIVRWMPCKACNRLERVPYGIDSFQCETCDSIARDRDADETDEAD